MVSGCGADDVGGIARDAKARTLSARYVVVVSQPSGRALYLSPRLTVIKGRRRVHAWTAANEEYTWRAGKRCYERHTDFDRADVREQRDAVWPKVSHLNVATRNGVRVLFGRGETSSDSGGVEYELHLDASGRIAMVRHRSARFGALPPGRWYTARYRYPTAAEFARLAGPPPRPRCA